MPIDLAGDLAAMYSTDEFAVTARIAHVATGGPSYTLPVIFDQPDAVSVAGILGVEGRRRTCRAQAASFSQPPRREDQLVVGTEILKIMSAQQTVDGLEWRLDLAPAQT